MRLKELYPVFPFLLLFLCLSFSPKIYSNQIFKCDSLIRSGVEAMNKKEFKLSLEILTNARLQASRNKWYKQEFLAVNNIGANYYNLLEYGEAIKHYLEAYTIAVKHLQPSSEMVVLNNIAILYSKERQYEKARDYFMRAYDIARKNNDTLKIGFYALNLGTVACQSGNSKLARSFFLQALPLLKNKPNIQALAKMGLADCDLAQGNVVEARTTALKIFKETPDLSSNDIGISLLTIISKSYLQEGNAELAAAYANEIMGHKPDIEDQIAVYELLSEINQKKQNYPQALAFKDSVLNVTVRLNEIKNGKLYESNRVKFEIENYKKQLAATNIELSKERMLFFSILAGIGIIVTLLVFWLRALSLYHNQKKKIAESNEHLMSLQLENEKSQLLLLEGQLSETLAITQLEQERLKNEVETKNRKLSAKALYLSGRNQMIEEVLSKLVTLPQVANDKSLHTQLQHLKDHLKKDGEWDSFIVHFEEVNQSFLIKLKTTHPSLTANDIRFISYLYMNLSTKEIASMLSITPESCRKRKERIAAKINLPSGINLYDYLTSI